MSDHSSHGLHRPKLLRNMPQIVENPDQNIRRPKISMVATAIPKAESRTPPRSPKSSQNPTSRSNLPQRLAGEPTNNTDNTQFFGPISEAHDAGMVWDKKKILAHKKLKELAKYDPCYQFYDSVREKMGGMQEEKGTFRIKGTSFKISSESETHAPLCGFRLALNDIDTTVVVSLGYEEMCQRFSFFWDIRNYQQPINNQQSIKLYHTNDIGKVQSYAIIGREPTHADEYNVLMPDLTQLNADQYRKPSVDIDDMTIRSKKPNTSPASTQPPSASGTRPLLLGSKSCFTQEPAEIDYSTAGFQSNNSVQTLRQPSIQSRTASAPCPVRRSSSSIVIATHTMQNPSKRGWQIYDVGWIAIKKDEKSKPHFFPVLKIKNNLVELGRKVK